jgi:aspartyl-tRNA(Asn)/glutamyl-tRNA(Gln) amidotransferase subunit C
MSVDRAEVDRIAQLARLSLGDEEADRLTAEMNVILAHVELLRTVDSEGSRTTQPREGEEKVSVIQGARDEIGTPDPLSESPSTFAPEWEEGFFVVPPLPGVVAEDDEG